MLAVPRIPIRGTQNALLEIVGLATGGGAATALTLAAGLRGVSTITHSGTTGLYYVNFAVAPAGTFLGAYGVGSNSTPAEADSFICSAVNGSYSVADKRFTLQVIDLGATPTLADLGTSEQIVLHIFFAESAKP